MRMGLHGCILNQGDREDCPLFLFEIKGEC